MARTFDSSTLALLAGPSLVERTLLIVRLPEGNFGFWTDVFDTTFAAYSGITFTGAGSLISVGDIVQTQKQTVQSLTVTLSGLDTSVLASVGTYNLHAGTVELARALYNPDTRALVAVASIFNGFIDRDTLTERLEGDALVSTLSLTCESRALEMDKATLRKRSNPDQKRWSSGDKGYEWTRRAGARPIKWGQESRGGVGQRAFNRAGRTHGQRG